MRGGFLVDVPSLGQLIASLSEAADRMRAANGKLGAACVADLGSVGLDWAAGAFQGRWEYGIGKISDAAEKMTDALRETRQLYEHIDQAAATLFSEPDATGATADGSGAPEPGEPSPISRALSGGMVRR